ncbi:uncharacterized protein LOC106646753 [Copidosoma floridanum]|uniref:uncharacterized protein LOC106646753 n=1 Tax=Copidosoma floridanum TaxID=29053 RepID=UPI0006C9B069|nr:uncharacterized protein LOC106646753 [Copidosoma floridanum]
MALSRIGASGDLTALFARSSYAASSKLHGVKSDRARPGKLLHASTVRQYPEAPRLTLPCNVSEIFNTETSRFAPERTRDIAAPVFLFNSKINNQSWSYFAIRNKHQDSHVDSYDCFGTVSLNGAMQTNVPKPFCSAGKATYLNMPGGQWSRDGKYLAEDMAKSHFCVHKMRHFKRSGILDGAISDSLTIRGYATSTRGTSRNGATDAKQVSTSKTGSDGAKPGKIDQKSWLKMSKAERLNIIIRDYGRTVIVFHVGISLVSLGIFYGLVSSGLDLSPMIETVSSFMGSGEVNSLDTNDSDKLAMKIMNEGSTFLIAYAIHKLFAPVRISTTLICTPLIVKYLRKKGVLKPPKSATAS